MRILVIANPRAGVSRRRRGSLDTIAHELCDPDHEVHIHLTRGPGDATRAAAEAKDKGYELVVAAGGDGTIHEVVNGVALQEIEMGVIPLGTENVLARELGVPARTDLACRHLLKTSARHLDLGKAGDQYFACFAGIGFDAHVAHQLRPELKARFGALAYLLTSLEQIHDYRKTERVVRLSIDGESHELDFWMMLVGNIQTYGGRLRPAPKARPDDGLLDLCLLPSSGYPQTLQQVLATATGNHLKLPGVRYFQARSIEIESNPAEHYQLDGEPTGMTPVNFEVVPRGIYARL